MALLLPLKATGGGSGLNTLVVVNANSADSCELGNYYCERREVPPENLLRIAWLGSRISWSASAFQTTLVGPLLDAVAARGLSNQIDYVVLSMDIPFQTVALDGTVNSTTSALFYGLKPDPLYGSTGVTNSYAQSERTFRQAPPATAGAWSFLATMITASTLDQAKRIVDQGLAGDGSFPSMPALLQKTGDPFRNIRYPAFDNAIFSVRLLANSSLLRTNSSSPPPGPLQGYQTGLERFALPAGTFVPGALADSLTSFGGVIFGPNTQTSLLAFVQAGAAGSYGTVAEPFTDTQKFPDPQVYFYQARGFNIAESYYQSIRAPYLGLIVAEPLSAPFAAGASGGWVGLDENEVLTGAVPLAVRFSSGSRDSVLDRIDLFIDGKYVQTLTNITAASDNLLTVTLNGYPIDYSVASGAALDSLAAGLAGVINAPENTNVTRVVALPRGDRIELRSISTNLAIEPRYFIDRRGAGAEGRRYRVSYLAEPDEPALDGFVRLPNANMELRGRTPLGIPGIVEASTDFISWAPLWTNRWGGLLDFMDSAAPQWPRRFYRLTAPNRRPGLALLQGPATAPRTLQVRTGTSLGYVVQSSTNLADWSNLATNPVGGSMDLQLSGLGNLARGFFRTMELPRTTPPPTATVVGAASSGGLLVRVDGAVQPYVVETSTNLTDWEPFATNYRAGQLATAVESSVGAAGSLTTFLKASRGEFLESSAFAFRTFYIDGSVGVGSWLGLTVTLTNGAAFSVAVTNQSGGGTVASLAQQLFNKINASQGLLAETGVSADDYELDPFGAPSFRLKARASGMAGTRIQANLRGSAGLWLLPSFAVRLTENLADIQSRNHLYVRVGAADLGSRFVLETGSLADGYHELTAVAYQGDSVRVQTRRTIPVRVQNSNLSATILTPDLPDPAPVQGTYHVQVTAGPAPITRIRLYSTGGLLGAAVGQASATFSFSGNTLGAGLHPFYAEIENAAGQKYRTEKRWIRLRR